MHGSRGMNQCSKVKSLGVIGASRILDRLMHNAHWMILKGGLCEKN